LLNKYFGGIKMSAKKKSSKKAVIWSVIGVILIAVILLFVFRPKNANMDQVTAQKGNITTYYTFSGSVEAKNKETIYADKAMQIKEIKVAVGQAVNKDDILLTTVSGEQIKAPITGVISNSYAEVNAQSMPGAKLLDIVDYSNLQLKVQVDEYDISAISVNKDATITINSLSKDVSGKIVDISKEGTYMNGVTYFTATVSIPNDPSILVGLSADAKVLNQSVTDVVTLPMTAIQFNSDNSPYVYMKNGKRLTKKVDLTLGINDGTTVEIKSGIVANDIVLVPQKTATTTFGGMQRGSNKNANSQNTASKGTVGGGSGQ
jgi:multidrug efflux pump subunit AcrA (membrane-fusion protein)